MKRLLMAAVMLLIGDIIYAQHQDMDDRKEVHGDETVDTGDSRSFLSAFKKGHFNGHFRYFFMSTQNQKGLTDYYANAVGGGLRYETAKFHGFQFAVGGFYTYNIGSSDLGKTDSVTGQSNRYEIALFDVEDPNNKNDIDRLEELYLKYNFRNSKIIIGKQLVNTPFMNLQDSRMRPTGVDAVWIEYNEIKKLKVEAGWIFSISPRSTTKWYDIGESIGVYPAGVNIDGTKSGYHDNLTSKGVFLVGSHIDLGSRVRLHAWNLFAENIFNTALLQTDISFPLSNNATVYTAAQLIRQDAVNNGGHKDAANTYFEKDGKALTFGAKAGWKNKRWETSVNFNRITRDGRYLMPREWGQEPFFTYLSRERNEGLGGVTAVMGRVQYSVPKTRIKSSVAGGYYKLPDVKNYRLNKYGVPSYIHLRADLQYSFSGIMKGMDAQFLVVSKLRQGESYNNKNFEFNKVDMVQYNLVLNYLF